MNTKSRLRMCRRLRGLAQWPPEALALRGDNGTPPLHQAALGVVLTGDWLTDFFA